MKILSLLEKKWKDVNHPFLIHSTGEIYFKDILNHNVDNLNEIKPGDVVSIIGDYEPKTIFTLIKLIELNAIIVPLTIETIDQHEYYFKSACVEYIIKNNNLQKIKHLAKETKNNNLIQTLKNEKRGGLVLFSSGTTDQPKAILHNINSFLQKFATPRPSLRTINFLLFDHIGGLNTLFHTLFNNGVIIIPQDRSIKTILKSCSVNNVELLPTTPTFLRLMLMSNLIPKYIPESLKIITYGTERMDQITLNDLCKLLPDIDFRQTYGMSELGILRIKSESKNSLFMKVGGEGIETKVIKNVLYIRSENPMIGYINARSPFSKKGWYNTGDLVEKKGDYIKIIGRTKEIINVGGLKFMPSEIEHVVLKYKGVKFAKIIARSNPITGQHPELYVEEKIKGTINLVSLKHELQKRLPRHMVPSRIKITDIEYNHRFKQKSIKNE